MKKEELPFGDAALADGWWSMDWNVAWNMTPKHANKHIHIQNKTSGEWVHGHGAVGQGKMSIHSE